MSLMALIFWSFAAGAVVGALDALSSPSWRWLLG